ncbi:peptidoglycan-binding domain-containing protein [Kitasatospora sp. GP82]|uniref:peptidoglycan recognition protein family protein n=1 Tax=Kitasatospora sp. GP82 TaxID=3035089 RepID=UPI00247473AA|nr:peptidoglycan-binding domain-containing protein [Kitasatospora sp. GP82]MDH6126761.1 hypothetical protein [Kitasatospora sp. GP82]
MARMPGAEWIGPTPNQYTGGMVEHRGLVLHIEQSNSNDSVDTWFKDPTAQASAHFTNPKAGPLQQLVDTDDAAWTEQAGNRHWVSVEHEGYSGDSLTASQIDNDAHLLAWLHTTYGVPLVSTDDPNGQGVGWHGMGGDQWGGHPNCPGEPIKAQRPQIIARAQQILDRPTQPPAGPAWPREYLQLQSPMLHDDNVRTWQQRMADRGWNITVDGWYGPASASICRQFQAEANLDPDGVVGPVTWDAAWTVPITN